jgi:uncharacterized repeat protein (TIGR03803 family)
MQAKKFFVGLRAILAIFTVTVLVTNTRAATQEKVLHSFAGYPTDGQSPGASLIFDAGGNLYGTTPYGGTYSTDCTSGCGIVFELTPQAGGDWTEQVLHKFSSNGTDGQYPSSGLIFDAAGNLYGATSGGGTYGYGTVFELTPTAGGSWTEQVLYSFNSTDGAGPSGLIFDAAGNLYGATSGGGTYGIGTVFELMPAAGGGWTEQVLHSFAGYPTDGYGPSGLIFDARGNLYGTTGSGGYSGLCIAGCGTVFELKRSVSALGGGWTEQVLHSFDPPGQDEDGAGPTGGLIFDARGNLYGTTITGGPYDCVEGFGCGTVFELARSISALGGGWTETVLYLFCSQDVCSDGWWPEAGLIFDAAGNLYGTTANGGAYGAGTVFEITR